MSIPICIYTVFKLFSLPSVAMTLRQRILNRYRFIWTCCLTFQIYSLSSFPSPVTAMPRCYHTGFCSQHLSLFTSPLMQMRKTARTTEGSWVFAAAKKGLFYCHRTLHPQILEIIGDVRLLYIVLHTMSNQSALRIKRLHQARVPGSLPERTVVKKWEDSQACTKHMDIPGKSQFLTGDNKEMPLHVKKFHLFLSNWKRFNWLRTQEICSKILYSNNFMHIQAKAFSLFWEL